MFLVKIVSNFFQQQVLCNLFKMIIHLRDVLKTNGYNQALYDAKLNKRRQSNFHSELTNLNKCPEIEQMRAVTS